MSLGWREEQLQWKPEWQVPKTPHDLTKRERGQNLMSVEGADLVVFADTSREVHALQIIFEFKAPDINAGKVQLTRYLASEPVAKMGYWTNGIDSLAIYKRHSADWVEVNAAKLPAPSDDLTKAPDEPRRGMTSRNRLKLTIRSLKAYSFYRRRRRSARQST